MGNADRIIRMIIAVVVATLYYQGIIIGLWGLVLVILAGVFVMTSFISFCPIYAIFGMNSCPVKKKN